MGYPIIVPSKGGGYIMTPIYKKGNRNMKELVIDKVFDTAEELEEYERVLNEQYIIIAIFHKDQPSDKDIYGIDTILYAGKRGE